MGRKKKLFIIPAGTTVPPNDTFVTFDEIPEALVFGDRELARTLDVTPHTIKSWRNQNLIPFEQKKGYCEFHLLSVINALRKAGYSQNVPGNPTAHNR